MQIRFFICKMCVVFYSLLFLFGLSTNTYAWTGTGTELDPFSNIIFISKAFQIDEEQNIIADIYDTVRYQDNNYVTITNGQYVRVTFEQILNNTKDITLLAHLNPSVSLGQVEVYPVYTDAQGNITQGPLIAVFENITEAKIYKVFLTNLETPTDQFDLKVISSAVSGQVGGVDIDYVVDPTSFVATQAGAINDGATFGNTSPGVAGVDYPNDGDSLDLNGHTVTTSYPVNLATLSDSGGTGLNSLTLGGDLTVTNTVTNVWLRVSGANVTITANIDYSLSFGAINIDNGATLTDYVGTFTQSSGDGFYNDGTISNISGTVTNSGAGSGIYNNDGTITDISGSVTNSGAGYGIYNASSNTITINSAPTITNTGGGISFINYGTVNGIGTITGGMTLEGVDSVLDLSGGLTLIGTATNDNSGNITPVDHPTTFDCLSISKIIGNINDGYSDYAMCVIPILVSSITVSGTGDATTVVNGSTLQMIEAVLPVDASTQTVTWSVINGTGSATIDASGLLTATGVGTVTVRATADDGSAVYGEEEITITTANISVTGVALNENTASMSVGATRQLTATIAPANATDPTVSWSSNNTAVATVSNAGLVTAVSAGTAIITVTTTDGSYTSTNTITVSANSSSGGGSSKRKISTQNPIITAPSTQPISNPRDLQIGSEGNDVKTLQTILNIFGYTVSSTGPGSIGNETAYFGEKTRQALISFQLSSGVVPANGYFGPKTRDILIIKLIKLLVP